MKHCSILFASLFMLSAADVSAADMKALIDTGDGQIEIELTPDLTPVTVANFANLAQRGFYNGLKFHRVIQGFMIQGGCPQGTGTGGPGYRFQDEVDTPLRHDRAGVLSMANAGPGTNGSQFFITHGPQPHLDGKHTVFGRVVKGQDVVDRLKQGTLINKISIVGDTSALFEQQKDKLTEWNVVLDQKYPRK